MFDQGFRGDDGKVKNKIWAKLCCIELIINRSGLGMAVIKRLLVLVTLVAFSTTGVYAQGFPNIQGAQDSLRDAMASW